jgi:site-specific recombinase XerD
MGQGVPRGWPGRRGGAPSHTPHQLWYTRGTDLIAQGQRVEVVQRVLGHCDIRSTLGYAELQDTQVRAALEGTTREAGWR